MSKNENISFLKSLVENKTLLAKEAQESKGLIYLELRKNNIEFTLEHLTGEGFNIFAIYEIEEKMLKNGKTKEDIEKLVIKESNNFLKLKEEENQSSLRKIAKKHHQEIKKIILENKDSLLKKSDLEEYLTKSGLREIVTKDELVNSVEVPTDKVIKDLLEKVESDDFEGFFTLLEKYDDHPVENDFDKVSNKIYTIFSQQLNEYSDTILDGEKQKVSDFVKKWALFINDPRNGVFKSYDNKSKNNFIKSVINKVPFNYLPKEFIESININNISSVREISIPALRQELIARLNSENKRRDDVNFNVLKALKLNWDNEEDRELFIKFVEVYKKDRYLHTEFEKSSFYKKILKEDIKKYLPILTEKYLDLSDEEKEQDFVIEKLKSLKVNDNKICISDMISFFRASDDYSNKDLLSNERLDRVMKKLHEDGIKFIISEKFKYGKSYSKELKSFAALQILNSIVRVNPEFLNQDFELSNVQEMMESIEEREYNSFQIIEKDFSMVLEFEKNMVKLIQNSYKSLDKIVETINEKTYGSSNEEFRMYQLIALLTKETPLDINELLVSFHLLNRRKDYSRNFHNGDNNKALLNKGYSFLDLIGQSNLVLEQFLDLSAKELEKEDKDFKVAFYKDLESKMIDGINKDDFYLNSRRKVSGIEVFKDIYNQLLIKKITDRNAYSHFNDKEYGQLLNVFITKFDHYVSKDEMKVVKEQAKKYSSKNAFSKNCLLNKDLLINSNNIDFLVENSDVFLLQFNKDNKYSDEDLSKVVNLLIKEESAYYSHKDIVNFYYDVIDKNLSFISISQYPITQKSLLKVVKSYKYRKNLDVVGVGSLIKESVASLFGKTVSVEDLLNDLISQPLNKENDNEVTVFTDNLDKVGFDLINDKKNYEALIESEQFEKLMLIINHFQNRKELSNVFDELDFDIQEKFIKSDIFKDVKLEADRSFSNNKGFRIGLNCQTLDELKRAREILLPEEHAKLIINGGNYYGKGDIALFEGGGIYEKIKIGNSPEIVEFIIDTAPVSTMNYYQLSRIQDRINRSLTGHEMIRLYRNIIKKTGSIFCSTTDVNADLDWLEIHRNRKNDENTIQDKNEMFKEYLSTLEILKEEPLLYAMYIYENRTAIDQLSYYLQSRVKENDYSSREMKLTKISPEFSPMYELSQIIKQLPNTQKMFEGENQGFDEDYVTNVIMANFIDFNVLKKGIIQGLKEGDSFPGVNNRLYEAITFLYKYEFYYSEPEKREIKHGSSIKRSLFNKEEMIELVKDVALVKPSLILDYGIARFLFKDAYPDKNYEINSKDLKEDTENAFVKFLVNEIFDEDFARKMLNTKHSVYETIKEKFFKELIERAFKNPSRDFLEQVSYSEKVARRVNDFLNDTNIESKLIYSNYSLMKDIRKSLGYNLFLEDYNVDIQTFIDKSEMELDRKEMQEKNPVKAPVQKRLRKF